MRTKPKYGAHVRAWRAQQPLSVRRRGMMRPKTFEGLMWARYPDTFIRLPDGRMLAVEMAKATRVVLEMADGSELSAHDFGEP